MSFPAKGVSLKSNPKEGSALRIIGLFIRESARDRGGIPCGDRSSESHAQQAAVSGYSKSICSHRRSVYGG